MTNYSAAPIHAPTNGTEACSAADIDTLVAACLSGSATQSTCSTWQQAHSACAACVVTQATSSTWGPFVCDSNVCNPNTGGCVDLIAGEVALEVNNGGKGSCGDVHSAYDGCVVYVCGGCTDPDLAACEGEAEQSECKSYFDATTTAPVCASIDAGTSACSPTQDADWPAFINLFCGSGQ